MTSTTRPGRHVRRRLRIGGIAAIAPVLAVTLALLLDGSPISLRQSADHHPAARTTAARAKKVSRDGGHGDGNARQVARPAPKPATGTHLMVDLASAPSLKVVRKWQQHSPYRAIGVYVDVASATDDRHDKQQKNLTASWVEQVHSGGWKVLPIYLAAQAPRACQSGRFHAMSWDPIAAQREGIAAADDAAASSSRLGLTSVPVMYDMEPYRAGCGAAVRAFFLGWTARLHQLGRLAGIYGLPSSLGRDLLAAAPDYAQPDVLWAATANGTPSTALRELPSRAWQGRRGNQFALDVVRRYGGKRLHVDDSAVDDAVWSLRHKTGADKTAPVLTVPATATLATRKQTTVRWTAVDEVSSRVAYQSQVRRTASGDPAGTWSAPTATGRRAQLRLRQGEQGCVRVRATDATGNASRWVRNCVSRIADDRTLRHGRGWHRTKSRGALHGRVLTAKHKRAKLALGHTAGGRLGVLLRGRGSATVRVDGHKVGVVRAGGMRWTRLSKPGTVTLTARSAHLSVDGYVESPR